MEGRFCTSPLSGGHEENGSFGECNNVAESPRSSGSDDMMKMSSASSPKRSRRAIQKKVVSIPLKDVEGSRLKGEGAPPPSDSWAWRKYGQKPIKGSPYPRGYYRCSSSKGCPARKQVERSRDDPTMLVITYSCEHNHPWPTPRNNHHHHHNHRNSATVEETKTEKTTSNVSIKSETSIDPEPEPEPEVEPESVSTPEEKFTDMKEEFGWFATPSSMVFELEGPIFEETHHCSTSNKNSNKNLCNKSIGRDGDMAMFFPMREEDESLFDDLGELPEYSLVFRHSGVSPQVQIY